MRKYRRPYRIKKKKSILRTRFFWRSILTLVFASVFLYFFFLSSIFQIKEINISGNEKVNTEAIRETIQVKNIFLINFEEIEKEILEKFPPIAKVDLKRKFPDKIIVQVEERKPVAIFEQGEEFFLIDREGIIFEKSSSDSPLLKVKKTEDGPLLKKGLVSSILEIKFKLEDLKIPPKEVLVVSADRLNIKTSEGWEIYFDPQRDLTWQTTKLEAVLEEEIPTEKRKNLQYIDLRFGNLSPYKYR